MAKAADWAARVKEWQASGKTSREFCVGRSFRPKNLVWWSSHFKRQATASRAKTGVTLARVVRTAVTAEPGTSKSKPKPVVAGDRQPGSAPIVVRVGRACVEISGGADRSVLVTVLEALVMAGEKAAS